MKRCDFCIDEKCEGKHNCNCATCSKEKECYRRLHATIRITNKCTQECKHCCFESSPKSNTMMTVEKAKDIAKFLEKYEITYINLMGGEFYCNPRWKEILTEFFSVPNLRMRIVSNGDWVVGKKDEVLKFLKPYSNRFYMCISHDKWHTNRNVDEALRVLEDEEFAVKSGKGQLEENGIVPVGRAWWSYSFYSSMGTFCSNPDNLYSFLIDEEGEIYRCGFGMWNFASIYDDFLARWKDFVGRHRKTFIAHCGACIRAYESLNDWKQLKRE